MRVNLYGGEGVGKSSNAAYLFYELKLRHISVELASEYVKVWAYEQRKLHKFDQIYLFGKQFRKEFQFLANGVKNIVTDSPLLLSAVYTEERLREPILDLCAAYEEEFPSLHIFLERGDKKYIQEGRYQTLGEAKDIDEKIFALLKSEIGDFEVIAWDNRNKLLNTVLEYIN